MIITVSGCVNLGKMLSDLLVSYHNPQPQRYSSVQSNPSGQEEAKSLTPSDSLYTTKYLEKLKFKEKVFTTFYPSLNSIWSDPSPNSPSTPGGVWVSFSPSEPKQK